MAKSIRETKLTVRVVHQALCRNCSFAGQERDTRNEAEDDAERHVLIPRNKNHRVGISTINTRVSEFRKRADR